MKIPLDLTPKLSLPDRHIPTYLALRAVVFAMFSGFGMFVLFSTVFPDVDKRFDFRSYGSAANTLSNPRLEDDAPVEGGIVPRAEPMNINATASGDFSHIILSLRAKAGTPNGTVSAVRAYRAFLSPIGEPAPFRDGSLLRTETGVFLVSEGTLRAFPDETTLRAFGTDQERFRTVTEAAIADLPRGADIRSEEPIPDGAVVTHGESYYQVRDGAAVPFVSTRAFRSRFRDGDALPIDTETFRDLAKSDEAIGVIDGTLLSYGEAVYAVEGTMLRPIDSPETFLSKGYAWGSVIPATGDEFGIYGRGRLYTEQQPHPDGTVFHDAETGAYSLVEGGIRREIPESMLPQYAAVVPVEAGVAPLGECTLDGRRTRASCELSFEQGTAETGVEYQFTYRPDETVALRDLEVRFVREPNRRNLDHFIAETLQKIRVRSPFSR